MGVLWWDRIREEVILDQEMLMGVLWWDRIREEVILDQEMLQN